MDHSTILYPHLSWKLQSSHTNHFLVTFKMKIALTIYAHSQTLFSYLPELDNHKYLTLGMKNNFFHLHLITIIHNILEQEIHGNTYQLEILHIYNYTINRSQKSA